jgi:hypothetical protein
MSVNWIANASIGAAMPYPPNGTTRRRGHFPALVGSRTLDCANASCEARHGRRLVS